ncbi:carbon monoxide dehydrogenase subunit G [Ramlibacter sp. AW1]|uniref:Carbon monoxide dehydrogenase subunit G n=1 Tax=Ramlibacter aurantiacus TaxID=2801330 RepID=A0A937D7I4_9BURK|nr:carbon monoxide dehydrogenase subunit G [Ramlibacter aurantiacus]MBL0423352.1 carbon monoxide dehydrogenase subunit G [Ramlibacter aurantiacus]
MKISNQQTLPVPRDDAWRALNDTAILQACIPGCESLVCTGVDSYELVVLAAIGPVKARFKGKLALSNKLPPESYELQFEGQGGVAGHGKGQAAVRLEPTADQQTVLHYAATATVGGKIAQIGQRLVDMAAQRMAADFFRNFNEQLQPAPAPQADPEASRPASLWARLTGKPAPDEAAP